MSRIIIGVLAVMIVGQGLLISKQNDLLDRLNVNLDSSVVDIDRCYDLNQENLLSLMRCTAFAVECQAAYKECSQ